MGGDPVNRNELRESVADAIVGLGTSMTAVRDGVALVVVEPIADAAIDACEPAIRADERRRAERMVRELRGLVSKYTLGPGNALRVFNLLHEDIWRITDEWAEPTDSKEDEE